MQIISARKFAVPVIDINKTFDKPNFDLTYSRVWQNAYPKHKLNLSLYLKTGKHHTLGNHLKTR